MCGECNSSVNVDNTQVNGSHPHNVQHSTSVVPRAHACLPMVGHTCTLHSVPVLAVYALCVCNRKHDRSSYLRVPPYLLVFRRG